MASCTHGVRASTGSVWPPISSHGNHRRVMRPWSVCSADKSTQSFMTQSNECGALEATTGASWVETLSVIVKLVEMPSLRLWNYLAQLRGVKSSVWLAGGLPRQSCVHRSEEHTSE